MIAQMEAKHLSFRPFHHRQDSEYRLLEVMYSSIANMTLRDKWPDAPCHRITSMAKQYAR